MARYIDADALEVVCFTDREGSFSDGVQWLLEYIDGLPSADVQPVVRCKDCKYASPNGVYGCRLERFSEHDKSERLFAYDYCSYGERKDD